MSAIENVHWRRRFIIIDEGEYLGLDNTFIGKVEVLNHETVHLDGYRLSNFRPTLFAFNTKTPTTPQLNSSINEQLHAWLCQFDGELMHLRIRLTRKSIHYDLFGPGMKPEEISYKATFSKRVKGVLSFPFEILWQNQK